MLCCAVQVILFGGQEFVRSEGTWPIRQSKDLYILDLGEYPLRWRNASVTNIRSSGLDVMAFPCISASSIPEQQAIALKYYKAGCKRAEVSGVLWSVLFIN